MTIINFPQTAGEPTDGSFIYTFGGVIYSWNGSYWEANSQSSLDDRYVEVAGDTMTGDLTVPSLNGGPLAGLRNQIINGDFRIWQRGTTTSDFTFGAGTLASDRYIADRWYQNKDTDASTARQVGPGGNLPPGFSYALLMSTFDQLCQGIELPADGTAGTFAIGTIWTVSYWCNQSTNIPTESPSVQFRQTSVSTGSVAVTTSPFGAAIETVVVGSETWYRYASTFTIDAAPTASHNQLRIGVSNGAAQGRITGVQLEPGPVATPFEQRPYGLELSLCQRYFCNLTNGVGGAGTTSTLNVNGNFPVEMRVEPTLEKFASASGTLVSLTSSDVSGVTLGQPTQSVVTKGGAARIRHTGLSGLTKGETYGVRFTTYGFDAEL